MGIFRQIKVIFMGIYRHKNWINIPMFKILFPFTFEHSERETFFIGDKESIVIL